jgi:hypothetical protein
MVQIRYVSVQGVPLFGLFWGVINWGVVRVPDVIPVR